MLIDVCPDTRAVLIDLINKSNRRGVVKITAQTDAVRSCIYELIDIGLVRRENEETIVVTMSPEERADVSQDARRVALGVSPADSSKHTARGDDGPGNGYAVSFPATSGRVKTTSEVLRERPGKGLERLPIEVWRGSHLAAYFVREVGEKAILANVALGPGPFNIRAISGSVNRWLREDGVSSADVKAMIDVFAGDIGRYTSKKHPAWRTFLARRTSLLESARRITAQSVAEERRGDSDYWTEASSAEHNLDPTYWS